MIRKLWLTTCSHPHHQANLVAELRRLVREGAGEERILSTIEPILFDGRLTKPELVELLETTGWRRDREKKWRCGGCQECGSCRENKRWK